MKNAFSLYTFLPSVFAGLCLGCTESHAKNITSLQKYILNLPVLLFYVLEKSSVFSVHLDIYAQKPVFIGVYGCTLKYFLCTPLYTFVL